MSRQINWSDASDEDLQKYFPTQQSSLQNPLLAQALTGRPVGLNQTTPVMQMLTNSISPGSQAPNVGQTLKDMASGAGQYYQSLMQNIANSRMGGGVPGIGMASSLPYVGPSVQQGLNLASNFNIPQALGVQNTPMNKAIQTGTGDVMAYGPTLMGGASLAKAGMSAIGNKLFPTSSNSLMKSISKALPNFTDQQLKDANIAYAKANPLLSEKINIDPFKIGSGTSKIPSREELNQYMPEIFQNTSRPLEGDPLNNPDIMKATMENWKNAQNVKEDGNNIFDSRTREELSPAASKTYGNFIENQTGNNLVKLRKQLQDEYYNTDPSTVSGTNKRQIYGPAFNKVDEMIQNHLSQDPNAIQGWLKGNQIYATNIHPIRNTPYLNAISQKTAGKFVPLSANKLTSDAQTAYDQGNFTENHPFFKNVQAISQALNREQNPGLMKKAASLGLSGLAYGAGFGLPFYAYKKLKGSL